MHRPASLGMLCFHPHLRTCRCVARSQVEVQTSGLLVICLSKSSLPTACRRPSPEPNTRLACASPQVAVLHVLVIVQNVLQGLPHLAHTCQQAIQSALALLHIL